MQEDTDRNEAVVERAVAFLRGHLAGVLRFDGEVRPIKIVIADDGFAAAPVMVAMQRSFDTTLCLPDEEDASLHLQVTLEPFEEQGPFAALADRWRIYHGDPPDVRWARMQLDAARFNGMFIDGDALVRPNDLAAQVPALCRAFNGAHADLVRAACLRSAEIVIERPVIVGVDPLGIDVRGAFDVVRIESDRPLCCEEDVLDCMRRLAG